MNPAPDAWPAPPLSEASLSAWLAQSHDLLVLAGADGRIHWCNPAFQHAFGSAAAVGLSLRVLLTADTRAGTEPDALVRAFGRHPDPEAGELALQLTTVAGHGRAVSARVSHIGEQTLWTLLDVTEQRQTRSALHHAAERTALVTRFAGIGTWDVDFNGKGEHWDEQMFLLRGLAPQAQPPSHEQRIAMVHPEDRSRVRAASPENVATTQVLAYEFRVRLPDGSYRWLASRSAPVLDASGRMLHRVGVNWDATDSKRAATADLGRVAAGSASPDRAGRILYIEDNAINVMLVEQMVLTLPGLELHAAETGQTGVARARHLQPDLILVDLQLPDFDGFEVLRRLRAQTETAATRCIALSANAMPDDIARGLRAGFDDYWTKPIDFKAFVADLEALFPTS